MKKALAIALLCGLSAILWWGETPTPEVVESESVSKKTELAQKTKLAPQQATQTKIDFGVLQQRMDETQKKIASAKALLRSQTELLAEMAEVEDLYDEGKLSAREYLERRADLNHRIHP